MDKGLQTYQHPPKVALVIGTFAAVPYIHLHLASWQRFFPSIPVLVADDGSPFHHELAELCSQYQVHFSSNPSRLRRTVGDMSSYVIGLDWAASIDADILVKMSRRFVPLYDWVLELQQLAIESQMPTFSQQCDHFNFGFRTECIAFDCQTWRQSGSYNQMSALVERNQPVFVEGFIHQLARNIASEHATAAAIEYMARHPRPSDRNGYAVWNIMATKRTTKLPRVLWHDCDGPVDYARSAALLGLSYSPDDFNDPNQGCGLGDP